MTRFWMIVTALVLDFTAGCSDDSTCTDCSCNLALCDGGGADTDGNDVGTDADVNPDASDDGATPEMDEAETNEDGSTACEGWLDPITSLCWQNPRADSTYAWDDAVTYCENFSLGEHGPGSWHLPTVNELRSLIRGCSTTETGGSCGVTDTCFVRECSDTSCLGCSYAEGPGEGGAYWPTELGTADTSSYWSSSSYVGEFPAAWSVGFEEALVSGMRKEESIFHVRCVR